LRYKKLKTLKKTYKVTLSLSFLEPCNSLNILTKSQDKCIITIHHNQSMFLKYDPRLGKGLKRKILVFLHKFFTKKVYPKADLIIAVSKGIKNDLIQNFNLPEEKIKVIYNPIYLSEILKFKQEDLGIYKLIFKNSKVLINVGRLTKQKGQWYLLRIFKELKKEFPELKLIILGEGELKNYLVKLSESLNLKTFVWDRDELSQTFDVYFLGFQKNPFKFIANSTLFVFTSLWEGLPMSLIEALACGIPIVSTDCKSGPREILAPSTDISYQTKKPEFAEYGILMPTFKFEYKTEKDSLTNEEKIWVGTLRKLLLKEDNLKYYSRRSIKRARDFDIGKIIKDWKYILDTL
jgi:glycosyltransferase involved in cell wall biosynthesis